MVGIQVVLIGLRASGIVHWPWWMVMFPAELVMVSLATVGAVIIFMIAHDNRIKRSRRA